MVHRGNDQSHAEQSPLGAGPRTGVRHAHGAALLEPHCELSVASRYNQDPRVSVKHLHCRGYERLHKKRFAIEPLSSRCRSNRAPKHRENRVVALRVA